jgi:hypothetical protein
MQAELDDNAFAAAETEVRALRRANAQWADSVADAPMDDLYTFQVCDQTRHWTLLTAISVISRPSTAARALLAAIERHSQR